MTSLLIKTVFLSFVLVPCACILQEFVSEGDPSTPQNAYETMVEILPLAGCVSFRPHDYEREQIVELHNSLRRKVAYGNELRGDPGPQPSAKNMRLMHYDRRLEDIAVARASMCSVLLSRDFAIQGYSSIFRSMIFHPGRLEPFNYTQLILHRYEHVNLMNGEDAIDSFKGVNTQTGTDVRSYAIMVNARTYAVGCAQSFFYHSETDTIDRYLICNYGSGLTHNAPLYDEGEPCEDVTVKACCDRGLVRGYCW